jgi:hypothetical protein
MEKDFIVNTIQEVLDKNFKSQYRRKINQHPDRLNFCCFFCGDSKQENKKRGNLYFNKLIYICFNCGKKTSLDKIIKEQGIQITPDQKLELIEHLNSQITIKDYEQDIYETRLDKLLSLDQIKDYFNSGDSRISDFKPIDKKSKQYYYLINRGIQENLHSDIYKGKYWNEHRTSFEDVIILLNRKGDSVLGIQLRNIKKGDNRFFMIINFETLYRWVNGLKDNEEIEGISDSQMVLYNKLSCYFNILNINFEKKITIFEGFLDSLFFPNSIGVVGTNTDFAFLENNGLDIQYFFDNDNAGNIKTEEKIKSGYPVFLWQKMFDWIVSNKNTDDPYKLKYRISKVKDLNALSQLVNDPYQKLTLDKFFSSDIMDLVWIPKTRKYTKRIKI